GARRAISFLQQRPEVNPRKIGIRGHSTGGVMTVFESIDPRVRAAVPSVGGCGFWLEKMDYVTGNTRGDGGADAEQLRLYLNTMACDAHWRAMHAPVFFLGASNDFNSPTDNVWMALEAVPPGGPATGWVLAPLLNHVFTPASSVTELLWFEHHLRGAFDFPAMPKAELDLETEDGIPSLVVAPDPDSKVAIASVDVYYSYGLDPVNRYWKHVKPERRGAAWIAQCPVHETSEPLFAFANVNYQTRHLASGPGKEMVEEFQITSSFCTATPPMLKQAGVKATEKRTPLIESFDDVLMDWIGNLKLNNLARWNISTRKVADMRYLGPEGAELVFDINGPAGSMLGLKTVRRNRSHNGGTAYYYHYLELPEAGWNTIRLKPGDFQNTVGEALDTWWMIEVIDLMDAQSAVDDKKKFLKRVGDRAVPALPSKVSQWNSDYYQATEDTYAKDNITGTGMLSASGFLRNMRWEGGTWPDRAKPWTIND
ncbi:MAG: alpha/beta hydrolase family protein, partial [Kiritimatiellia bacterium]